MANYPEHRRRWLRVKLPINVLPRKIRIGICISPYLPDILPTDLVTSDF